MGFIEIAYPPPGAAFSFSLVFELTFFLVILYACGLVA